jgi:protein-tyrosine phosphatase
LSFSTLDTDDVPDPYYGEGDGFERVLDLLETSLDALALKIANHQTVI